MRVVDHVLDQYHYAMGDASNAYSREKLKKFTREVLYAPGPDLLFVFDRVVSTHPSFKKAWLLHGVSEPSVDQGAARGGPEAKKFKNASTFCFREGLGELLVYSLLPRERVVTRRGGLVMISTLQAMTTAAPGEPEKIGRWSPLRADRCRKIRSSSKCGRLFGAATSPGFPLRTARTWCRAHGASKCHR